MMKRKPKTKARKARIDGEGSIYPLANGRFRAALPTGRKTPSGRPEKKTRTCRTRADAVAALEEMKRERSAGTIANDSCRTVGDMVSHWLETVVRPNLAFNTYVSYSSVLPHLEKISQIRLKDFSRGHVKRWLREMSASKIGRRMLQHTFDVLQYAVKAAIDVEELSVNPCDGVTRPKHKSRKIVPFPEVEAKILMSQAEGNLHVLVTMGLSTGMRINEIVGLKWSNVDLRKSLIHVRLQSGVGSDGNIVLRPPKTEKSVRVIAMPARCRKALVDQQARLLRAGLASSEFVVCGPNGEMLHSSHFDTPWKQLLRKCKLAYRGVHHLRHTFATLVLSEGQPVHIVSRIMGHASPTVTWNTYSHVLPGSDAQIVTCVNRLLG